MENYIAEFIEEILSTKHKRSETKKVMAFLNGDFEIYRLTPQKRVILEKLFEESNLAIYHAGTNKRLDWFSLDINDEVYIMIRSSGSKSKQSKPTEIDHIAKGPNDLESYGQTSVEYKNAGEILISEEESYIDLYKHQEEAIQKLNDQILKTNKTPFSGLLVLPTGGGKTLTAAYWLSRNFLDKNKKVLWIAHRHELLEQAKRTFHEDLAFHNIFRNKKEIKYRIISGIHDRPVKIKASDDIIISSKDSLNSGFHYLLDNWIKKNNEDIFLVVDEAHHATAKTYRKLINDVKANVKHFRMLGLTATPFRTAENEKGLLSKVFPDGIVAKEDLRTLIHRGILSEPIFEEVKTNIDFTNEFSEDQLTKINHFDLSSLDNETVKTISENKERNWVIVNQYTKEKKRYRQTIVFALNQANALALNSLFKAHGVKSDVVISSIRDAFTGVTRSSKDNDVKLKQFRDGTLDVLINVNILTEGMDFPKVQSIFLARPTISTILMTQMIGRGLRGEKSKGGGTKKAFIVSFIDNWQDKVAWVNPEKLFIEENIDFNDKHSETRKQLIRLISIHKLEEFAILANQLIDTTTREELEKLDFIERIPLGFYFFSVLTPMDSGEAREKNCEVLIYSNLKQSFDDFLKALPDIFKKDHLAGNESITEDNLNLLCEKVEDWFFYGCDLYPAFLKQDIKDILQYYAQTESVPACIGFDDREKYDISKIARELKQKDFHRSEEEAFKTKLWESNTIQWKAFFGYDKRYFLNAIDLALRKELNKELYQRNPVIPQDKKELRKLEEMSMDEIHIENPRYWRYLSDKVYEKHLDNDGFYVSASKEFKSKNKGDFQIDHIQAQESGGRTKIENLQLLTIKENALKGRN